MPARTDVHYTPIAQSLGPQFNLISTYFINCILAAMLGMMGKKRYRRRWDDDTDHKGIQGKVWTGFIWLKIGTSGSPLRRR